MKKLIALLSLIPILSFGQLLGPPSAYTKVTADTLSDTALFLVQVPGYLSGQTIKMRSMTKAQLALAVGGGGSGCPTGGDCTFNSVTAKIGNIDTLNKNRDTIYVGKGSIFWNGYDSLQYREWGALWQGSIAALGHVDTYLSGRPYLFGPDSGIRLYQRLTIGSPYPDSANASHIIYSWSAGGYPLVPIKFVMNNGGSERERLQIDTGNFITGWVKSFGSFWTRNKLLVRSDAGPYLGQPVFVNSSSIAEFNGDSLSQHLTILAHGPTAASQFTGYATGGTATSPSATIDGQQLAGMYGRGWANGAYTGSRAGINTTSDRAWTSTSQGAYIRFDVTDSGSTTMSTAMQLYRKNLFIGSTSIVTGGSQNLVLSNTATAPTVITDRVALYARDRTAGNATFTVSGEAPIETGASTPTMRIPFCYGSTGTPVCGTFPFTPDP